MPPGARERFLRAIAERIPPERVEEIRLFGPIRQGGQESGVAVIASRVSDASAAGATADSSLADSGSGHRLAIFRAQYRLTRKGPERGRWEGDVTAEADAPLSTVDDVVRGVQRRAGDDAEPERLTADGLRAALSDEPWTATPR